ncbi:MAG: divalent-cation tolerance protein CutA, partial [Elusimicrobiota bacterium]|nr:divalent-cation tolerance protein CutA [Elusimicrobiota bacterium]
MKFIDVFVTVPNRKVANVIIKHLLNEKIIACAGIVSNFESFYW